MNKNEMLENTAVSPVRFSITVPRHLHDELERTAKKNDASIAWVVRKAVASYLQSTSENPHQDGRN
jgi:metal-responsive CopG/Arc/MetJ family transcriptional regulator